MSNHEHFLDTDELHPIDVVESLAELHQWEFDRVADDQIAMAIEGAWKTYSLTLAWSTADETLRLLCSFEMEVAEARQAALFDIINRANDLCWTGAFVYWPEQNLMVFRYGLPLSGDGMVSGEQVERLLSSAVVCAEKFYPAFQLVVWGGQDPARALGIAMNEAYGRA